MSSNLEPLIPMPLDVRRIRVIILGFAAALCWWIGIVGVIVSGGGAQALQVFLAVPVLLTIGTALVAHRRHYRHRRSAKHVHQAHSHRALRGLPARGSSVVLLCGFTAALCWWIGIVAVVTTGGGARIFLAIPVLATVVTFLAARKRPAAA